MIADECMRMLSGDVEYEWVSEIESVAVWASKGRATGDGMQIKVKAPHKNAIWEQVHRY